MAETNLQSFDKRMARLNRKHEQLSKGFVHAITDDGLIVAQPRRRFAVPWRPLLIVIFTAFALKVGLYTAIGSQEYSARVAQLAAGGQADRIGAWIMTPGPATVAVSERLAALRR